MNIAASNVDCLYGVTGRHDEAHLVWREIMEINCRFSVEHLKRALPYWDPHRLDRLMRASSARLLIS